MEDVPSIAELIDPTPPGTEKVPVHGVQAPKVKKAMKMDIKKLKKQIKQEKVKAKAAEKAKKAPKAKKEPRTNELKRLKGGKVLKYNRKGAKKPYRVDNKVQAAAVLKSAATKAAQKLPKLRAKLGQLLKSEREKLGLGQRELMATGLISQTQVSMVEAGKTMPSFARILGHLQAIAKAAKKAGKSPREVHYTVGALASALLAA